MTDSNSTLNGEVGGEPDICGNCGIPADEHGPKCNEWATAAGTGPVHDDRCCMEGVAASAGPHPDCPGVEALNEAYAAAKAENDFAADLAERE